MASIDTTTTVQTDTATQLGKQVLVTPQSNTVTIGNLVTDVSIQPYIANRIVSFYAYNMRPNQRIHVFFDSVLVDQYCAPGIVPLSITSTADYNSIQKNGNWGDPIITNSFGEVAGQFNIPEATFKTGDRVIELCDVTSIAQGNDAITTVSHATFTASNLNVTKESVTLTTVNPQISVIPVSNTIVTTNTTQTIVLHPDIDLVTGTWYEPIAQGLTINTPNNEAGIFATSIDIYFKQKSQIVQNGVTVYLCETLNGYPNGSKVIPFSTVHLPFSSINVSDDSSIPTNFKFEAPVFLNNGVEYAFIVKPDAGDPDYFVYSANLGDIDVQTGAQVFSQPTIGTAFFGATDNQWTALQTEYIKFELYRAKFSQQSGDAYFKNANTDFLTVSSLSYSNSSAGIIAGDYVFQSTNSLISTINTSIYGIINYYDSVKQIFYVANSTGNFTSNSYVQVHRFTNATASVTPGPNTSTVIATANTGLIHNVIMDAFVPQIASIAPAGTTLSLNLSGTSNSYVVDSFEFPVNSGTETEFLDKERLVVSKSNEVVNMSGTKSLTLHARMTTDSELISPIIDTTKYQQLAIANDIDPTSFIYEEFLNSGASKSKYVSQIITLAALQDAQDLQVILSAYRPANSEIQVWVKFLNGQDSDPMSAKTWVPLINTASNLQSDPNNTSDLKEFTYIVPKYYGMIPSNGTITSTNVSTTVTGVGTLFGTEVKSGWFINMLANNTFQETTRKVVAVANTTSLTLDVPFNGNYTGQPYFIVSPPTTAWLSTNNVVALNGTVSTYTTNNSIVGSGTNFTGQLTPGSIIQVAGADKQTIVSITNSTFLSVGTPWSSNLVANTAALVMPAGVTYLDSSSSLYSTFIRFQIKVILQADNSAAVPQVSDVRALALQL